ncbi:HNH endonuclease [Demequina sp.]|uniref:HNH endonuclease n=1 Tax=Demequina sp. TaxID=2050685 RepID=UPI0025BE3CA7|nr:HNH endonuclease [Demequina sp.]
MPSDTEELRRRIFADVLVASKGGTQAVSREFLLGYDVDGQRLPLVDPQGRGIRNREDWPTTLSIVTSEKGRYLDTEIAPGVWTYPLAIDKHGRRDPSNGKLVRAHEDGVPVLYFYKPIPKQYLLIGQVYITAIDLGAMTATVELAERAEAGSAVEAEIERMWIDRLVRTRLHQPRFRMIVMDAYTSRCAICALPEASLLDAAHIRGDTDPNGQPVVENGLALCSIHHRAYDAKSIGIDENYRLHVSPRLLAMDDGPVLVHAIQAIEGKLLTVLPERKKRPDPYRLDLTFKEFLDAQ